MILKVFGADNAIHLIENVKDVAIHLGTYAYDPDAPLPVGWGPYTDFIVTGPYIFHQNKDPRCGETRNQEYVVKVVDYLKDDYWRRLLVNAFAYVCTDEGKTIEKIVAER